MDQERALRLVEEFRSGLPALERRLASHLRAAKGLSTKINKLRTSHGSQKAAESGVKYGVKHKVK